MSKTGTTNFEALEEMLGVEGEMAVTIAIHDLTHALGADLLELMLAHAKEKEEKKPTRSKKTEEVVHSNAKSMEDKLAEAAQHLRDTADALIRNEMGIPEDVSEIIVEVKIKGR